jgi:hypothetical protein
MYIQLLRNCVKNIDDVYLIFYSACVYKEYDILKHLLEPQWKINIYKNNHAAFRQIQDHPDFVQLFVNYSSTFYTINGTCLFIPDVIGISHSLFIGAL